MRSLRTKITLMTLAIVVIVVSTITLTSVSFIQLTESRESDQLLLLLCETGERNLDYYFNSVQKSVNRVAAYVEADLDGISDEKLASHINRVGKYFEDMSYKTNGVLTYYYRIDPDISKNVKGFWYIDLDGNGFAEHEVTDITLYDTSDTSSLVWFTVPKYEGKPVWLPPYITDNLDVRVISYNMPIYWRGTFVGVVGIEIDYSTMAEQVDSIRLHSNGYAFLNDSNGELFYHPKIDVTTLTEQTMPAVPEGMLDDSTFIRYRYDGQEKTGAWLPLSNGMRLNVVVPLSETNGDWQKLIDNILIVGAAVLIAASAFVMFYTERITKPLVQLTDAANQADKGNYEYELTYDKDDELGRLTNTFKRMSQHMKDHISDLNKQVFVDALTHVKNKGAFSSYIDNLQQQMNKDREKLIFAIGIFDCNDLKSINDQFGHSSGDTYIKTASRTICRTFQHSPVFRIGGDEFSVILENEDYQNREELAGLFDRYCAEVNESTSNRWEQVHVAMGIAAYDPDIDTSVNDVIHRADKLMYDNKKQNKQLKTKA